ncbi:MAG: ATPase [Ardenticatenales bacterium]|nr:ATPase [Ardenticatenales bacterium]
MDILHLIDRLEQTLNEGQRVWLTAKLMVDEDRVYGIVDQMRVAIPDAIKRANRVEAEKDRILAQAHEEADRIRNLAKQEAEELISRDAVMTSAQQRADNILERARRDAEAMRHDADAYTIEVLARLEEDLLRSLSVVRNGLQKLQADQGAEMPAESQPG